MNALIPLVGEESTDQMMLLKNMGHTGWAQFGIIVGALGAVALIIFLVVYCFRKKLFNRGRRHHHRSAVGETEDMETSGGGRRKSRRSHRPMNPTLAQTRGLPPLRDEKTPPPGL